MAPVPLKDIQAEALLEIKKFLLDILQAPVSEEEKRFGNPRSYLEEHLLEEDLSLVEIISIMNGREFRLNGAGLKMWLETDDSSNRATIIVAGDQARYYRDFLSHLKKMSEKYTLIDFNIIVR